MACSQGRFAAGGGSNWQKLTVQMGIKFSLMFIICQKRIILCQSGLEELLLRSLQKFLFDKMEFASLRYICESQSPDQVRAFLPVEAPLATGLGTLSVFPFSGSPRPVGHLPTSHSTVTGFELRVQKENSVLFWNFGDPQRDQCYPGNVIQSGVN